MDKIELLIKAIAVNLWLPKKHGVKKSNNATNVQHIDITPLSHLSLSLSNLSVIETGFGCTKPSNWQSATSG